ncbi:MAG: prolyl aminopeptidase [Pseudomonadales bacterium]|nr:prolyl aminopeptidase [Pseudomonadales bacterium]
MQVLFPEIKPYAEHRLTVDDTHSIYVEESGSKNGFPVLFLHGGPGGGTEPFNRRFFDPDKYRIILFDQRGCGKSRPHGCLTDNRTQDLINDIEKIRFHLKIDKWLLFGGSWGSTLALLYAQAHPNNVLGLIVRGIFLSRPQDLKWLYQEGANRIFPDAWSEFVKAIPDHERTNLLAAYEKRLNSDNELECMSSAKSWSLWEGSIATLKHSQAVIDHFSDPHTALSLAKIEVHYFLNNSFIRENQIIEEMDKICHLPGIIIHGRFDMVCPLDNAIALKNAWSNADLNIIREAGHASSEPGITDALIKATHDMARFLDEQKETK